VHGGLLTQVWKDHIRAGRPNPLKEDRKSMEAAGLDVMKIGSRRTTCPSRLLNKLMLQQYHLMRKSRPDATFSEAYNAVRAMSLEERAEFERNTSSSDATGSSLDDGPHTELCLPCGAQGWNPSDGHWPIDPAHIVSCAGALTGLAGAANRMRWNKRKSMTSTDEGIISPDTTFLRRFACWERHPGLCFAKDAVIYNSALRMSSSIERFCRIEFVGRYLLLRGTSDAGDEMLAMPLYVSERRARRSFAPQVVVFTNCAYRNGPHEVGAVSFDISMCSRERDGRELGEYDFSSVWSVSKRLLLASSSIVDVSVGVHETVRDAAGYISATVTWGAESTRLYPQLYKPPVRVRVETPLDGLIDAERPAKIAKTTARARGGMKGYVCVPPSLVRAVVVEGAPPPPILRTSQ
jgi:hypothetical protein